MRNMNNLFHFFKGLVLLEAQKGTFAKCMQGKIIAKDSDSIKAVMKACNECN